LVAGLHLVARPTGATGQAAHRHGSGRGTRVMRNYYRKVISQLVVAMCAGAVLLALVPLALILFYVVTQGISAISWSFFTKMPSQIGDTSGGMANGIVGSLIVTGIGALFAIPLGV